MAQLPPQRKLDPALKGPVEPGSPQGCTKLHPSPWAWGQGQGTKLGTPGLMLEAGQYIKRCWAIRSNQSGETGTSEIVASPNASTSEALPGTPSKKLVPGEGNTRRKGPQRERIRKPTHFLSPPLPSRRRRRRETTEHPAAHRTALSTNRESTEAPEGLPRALLSWGRRREGRPVSCSSWLLRIGVFWRRRPVPSLGGRSSLDGWGPSQLPAGAHEAPWRPAKGHLTASAQLN